MAASFVTGLLVLSITSQMLLLGFGLAQDENCVESCTVNEVCLFNKPHTHKQNASIGEFTAYITRRYECALIRHKAEKRPIDSFGHSTTGLAQFLYTPNILQNEPYPIKQAIIYNTSCPTGQLAYFDLIELDLGPGCRDYLTVHQPTPHHIFGQDISCSGTPLVGNISHLLFRSDHVNKDGRKGFKGYLQCFDPSTANFQGCIGGSRSKRQSGSPHIPSGKDLTDLHILRDAAFTIAISVPKRNFSDQDLEMALKYENSCNSVLQALSRAVINYTEGRQPGRMNGLRPTTTTNNKIVILTPPTPASGHCVNTTANFPKCSKIGYQSTYLPNFELESSNVTEILKTMALYESPSCTHQCSNALFHLVCLVYAPVCVNNTRYKICRSLCEYVKADCTRVYVNQTLPELLNCDNSDIYSTASPSVCPPSFEDLQSCKEDVTTAVVPIEEEVTTKKISIRPPSESHTCSTLTSELSFCSSMNWTVVSFPNWRKHKSQREAGSEITEFQYSNLVSTNCSPHIRHLICSYYAPVCTGINRISLLPCQSWCQEIAETCVPFLNTHSIPIPDFLQCTNFPEGQPCFYIPE